MSESTERDPTELQALLRRAAGGDSAAWRAIVGEFAPRVYGLLRAQCGDSELSEEIAQSTFCTLAAKIGEYVESGRFESWVFRIAMNRLRDEMRRRKRHARPMDDAPLREVAGRGSSGVKASDAAAAEVRERLARAMGRLPEADREIIDLRHTGGMSFKALSDFYGEPVGTLLARHHRALRKLRGMLEDMGVTADDAGEAG
ncbi:MAG: RNA polymerase sigma factor [Phycisphaerales bacterium]|jgi:RNA polymerase sigma-70 factor (ECF subfamily)